MCYNKGIDQIKELKMDLMARTRLQELKHDRKLFISNSRIANGYYELFKPLFKGLKLLEYTGLRKYSILYLPEAEDDILILLYEEKKFYEDSIKQVDKMIDTMRENYLEEANA